MFEPVATPISADVPLLIGSNKDEGTFLLQSDAELFTFDEAGLNSRVKNSAGGQRRSGRTDPELYRKDLSRRASRPTTGFRSTPIARCACARSRWPSARRRSTKAPVYMYFFAWNTVGFGGKYKALHMAEIPFVFDNIWAAEAMTHGCRKRKRWRQGQFGVDRVCEDRQTGRRRPAGMAGLLCRCTRHDDPGRQPQGRNRPGQ